MENSLAIVDVTIPFAAGVDQVEKAIEQFLAVLPKDNEDFIKVPKLLGAYDFTETEVVVRIIAETKPMRHYDCTRIIGIGLKKHLEQEGIEIPYPTLVTKSFTTV